MTGESARLEAALAEAARLQGEERVEATLRALAVADRGQYLEGLELDLDRGAARPAGAPGRRRPPGCRRAVLRRRALRPEAARLVDAILEHDAFREAAHRLEMRIANAIGDEDRVIAAYRHCERVLGELGTTPSSTTRRLLETLRR